MSSSFFLKPGAKGTKKRKVSEKQRGKRCSTCNAFQRFPQQQQKESQSKKAENGENPAQQPVEHHCQRSSVVPRRTTRRSPARMRSTTAIWAKMWTYVVRFQLLSQE